LEVVGPDSQPSPEKPDKSLILKENPYELTKIHVAHGNAVEQASRFLPNRIMLFPMRGIDFHQPEDG
jgi:hypothetical protein